MLPSRFSILVSLFGSPPEIPTSLRSPRWLRLPLLYEATPAASTFEVPWGGFATPPLSLELPLLHGFLRQLSLLGESLADVHALVLEDLEGELYGSVLGLGNPAVG